MVGIGFLGMKIMEFGFYDIIGNSIDIFYNYIENIIVYVGIYDNEVINGWFENFIVE